MAKKRKTKNNFKKVKKRVVTTLVFVGLISTISVTAYGLWAARNILQPISTYASESISINTSQSEAQTLMFVLILDEEEYVKEARLVMINNEDSNTKETVIPPDTLLHLPYGLKEFKLKSLYKIAQLENSANTFNLINQTLIEYFGVSTQKMIILKNNISDKLSFNQWLENPQTMIKLAFNESWVKENLQTNESRLEILKIARHLQNIPDQNKNELKVEEAGIVELQKGIDNASVYITDQNKLDSHIKKSFQTDLILEEKADIIIENGTETQGLASKVSRIISNSGGVVIELKNSENVQETTTIAVNDKKWIGSATLQQIQMTLPLAKIENSTQMSSKADIVITLGKDYAKMITGENSASNSQ